MQEIWKDIDGYDLYEISSRGRVRNKKSDCILAQAYCKSSYLKVNLYGKPKIKTIMVHRLVANAFCDNPLDKPQVNHIDGNKENNHADNLEWCTNDENQKHAEEIGLIKDKRKIVLGISIDGSKIMLFNSIKAAERSTGLFCGHISNVCKGRNKTAGGAVWMFI